MAETRRPRSALEGVLVAGTFGAAEDGIGLTIGERRPLALVHVGVREGDDATRAAVGVTLPALAGQTAVTGETRAIWLAPDRWLLCQADADGIRRAAPAAAVNDVSSGRTVLRLSGPRVRDVLASDCPLDLHPSAFGPGRSAATLIGHFGVVLDCVEADVVDVYVARGFALDFWHWLTETAAEWGYRVDA